MEEENIKYEDEEPVHKYDYDEVSGRRIKKQGSVLNKTEVSKTELDNFFDKPEEDFEEENFEEEEPLEDCLEDDDELSNI